MGGKNETGTKLLTVRKVIDETPDTRTYVLESQQEEIIYKAGQFLTFLFNSATGSEARRSYSFSSSPDLKEPVTITIKRIVNGEFSRLLQDKVKPGSVLKTIGASGFFVLPENMSPVVQIVFAAAGSGITPVFSLLKSILYLYPSVKVLLIYSNRSLRNTIFYDKLEALKEKHFDRLKIEYLFSNSSELERSRLTPDILEALLTKHEVIDFPNTLFYVCGPASYMRMVSFTLLYAGVPQGNIKKEIFFVRPQVVVPVPPDTREHPVRLLSPAGEHVFNVQYPVSMLQAAKLLHINIPYSCENGQCGTCVAKCLHGEVWMSRNEVLLDAEVDAGLILTCTGFPVNGAVTIKI